MAQILRDVILDVSDINRIQAIMGKQYDKLSRYLKVELVSLGEKIMVESNATVTINARRPNGTAASYAGSVNADGTVTVPLTYWMLQYDGTVLCDISIIVGDTMLTSASFELAVQKATVTEVDIETDEDYPILVQLINEVEDVKDEYEQSVTDLMNTVDAKMDQVEEDVQAAIDATQLVTGPFYIVDTAHSKTYLAAIQIRNGKPVLLYDEYTPNT